MNDPVGPLERAIGSGAFLALLGDSVAGSFLHDPALRALLVALLGGFCGALGTQAHRLLVAFVDRQVERLQRRRKARAKVDAMATAASEG